MVVAATTEGRLMPARATCAPRGLTLALLLALLLASPALAANRTAVQDVPCEPGPELRLARDGTVSACRLAAAADLLVGPAAGNGEVACAAGGRAEFYRNGYLSFCNRAGAGASYLTRTRSSTRCRSGARVAFDENGYLEYCS
jgi:hypothetical protein